MVNAILLNHLTLITSWLLHLKTIVVVSRGKITKIVLSQYYKPGCMPCSYLMHFVCTIYKYKTQNKVYLIPNYSVNINRLPSLQPAVCMYFIPSLLLFADVQTFCSEKESLFVTLESSKERETTRSLPVSLSVTIQPTKQQIPISIQRLRSCRPQHAQVLRNVEITGFVVI